MGKSPAVTMLPCEDEHPRRIFRVSWLIPIGILLTFAGGLHAQADEPESFGWPMGLLWPQNAPWPIRGSL